MLDVLRDNNHLKVMFRYLYKTLKKWHLNINKLWHVVILGACRTQMWRIESPQLLLGSHGFHLQVLRGYPN